MKLLKNPVASKGAVAFLESERESKYDGGDIVFTQGDVCSHVFYIRSGAVKVSAVSTAVGEAVVAILGPGEFFGEGCLAGQPCQVRTAIAIRPSAILFVGRARMARLLKSDQGVAGRFISHMLNRKAQMERDLIDQLFDAGESRLAVILLRLAGYGRRDTPVRTVTVGQARLAVMVGTSKLRIHGFLGRFRQRGFIAYSSEDRLTINHSLLRVVLRDES